MNDSIKKRIQQIDIENYIWIVYLFIIGFSFYANKLEKDYFLDHNIKSKERYRKINASIFAVLIVVYSYFEKESIESLFQKKNTKVHQYDILSFIATSAVLLSGILFFYIIIVDKDIDEEIAFN
jgi:hypothetical protein